MGLQLTNLRSRRSSTKHRGHLSGVAQAVAMVVVVAIPNVWPSIAVLPLAGAASILVLSNISATLLLFLPAWVRGHLETS